MLDIDALTDTRPPAPFRFADADDQPATAAQAARDADRAATQAVIRFIAARRTRAQAADRYERTGTRTHKIDLMTADVDLATARLEAVHAAGEAARLADIASQGG